MRLHSPASAGLVLCSLLASSSAPANTYHVRQGAKGSGTSWNDALGDLPSSMSPSDTYYVAAGTYRGGSLAGQIKRATAADHGNNTGWQSAYDGQVELQAPLTLAKDDTTLDGATWHGFKVVADAVTGSCSACGTLVISGDRVTIRNLLVTGNYSGGFGHSVGLAGSDTTIEACHFYKTYQEDTFGGEPGGTLTIRRVVVEMPSPPGDGVHRDVFNPYTAHSSYNILVEDSVFSDIWLMAFLFQDPTQIGDITFRRNVIVNGSGFFVMFGSSNKGAQSVTFEHNTFYNYADFMDSVGTVKPTYRDNIYARSSSWHDSWGGTDVHVGGSTSHCLFLTDPSDFLDVTDPLGPDGVPGTVDDGFRLLAKSAAIGGATDGTDIGAYQYSGAAQPQVAPPAAPTGLSVSQAQ